MKPSQIAATLPKLLKTGRTPFIWGDPGIGKSDIVRAVAGQMGIDLIDIRLSLYDPTDLRGFPVVRGTGKNEVMHFVSPAIMPRSGKGILLLDEMPAAPPAVQAVAYQLILDRRLGEYKLPDGWNVVAAGNHARNGGVHYSLAPALANRFVHIDMSCSAEDWDVWAAKNDITFLTRAFMKFRPALIHDINARKSGLAFPSPRSWAFADDIVKQQFGLAEQLELLKGTVGEGAATEYLAFIRVAKDLPSIKEIIAAPDTAKLPTSPGAMHAVVLMAEKASDAKNFSKIHEYIGRMPKEFQTAFMHSVARNKMELTSTKEYVNWCVKNSALLGI